MPDAQAAAEKTQSAIFETLCGPSVIYGAGMLELGLAMSLEQMVIDNDILKMAQFACNGIDVREETVGMDDIMQVPPGGDYLTFPNTMAKVGITSNPHIYDRGPSEQWQKDGCPDLADRAHVRAQELLAMPDPELPEGCREELDAIIENARKRLASQN